LIIVLISWNNYLIMENKDSNYCYYSGLPSAMAYMEIAEDPLQILTIKEVDRIIEMAWEDRTPFDAIEFQFGLNEAAVKGLMKKKLKFSSYILWRKRVNNCNTKHASKRITAIKRFKCNLQRSISHNKISKRR
jgi:uncharacterized protein (TIGR03643 family)